MYGSMNKIQFTTFFNDVLNRFYEDERDVKRLGETLGFDVEEDYFVAVAFLYPSIEVTSFEEKEQLKALLSPIQAQTPVNQTIKENQMLIIEKGVVTFLIGKSRQEISDALPAYREEALKVIEEARLPKKVRIGIGMVESGVSGLKQTCDNAVSAIRAGEIFKKERTVLEYMGMEIYSSINAMITSYGERMTGIVLKQLDDHQQRVLQKYYKCKEEIGKTAEVMGISEEEVTKALSQVKENTGLDVNDTEDNFKLHLVMIAKKVLGTNEKIEEAKKKHEI